MKKELFETRKIQVDSITKYISDQKRIDIVLYDGDDPKIKALMKRPEYCDDIIFKSLKYYFEDYHEIDEAFAKLMDTLICIPEDVVSWKDDDECVQGIYVDGGDVLATFLGGSELVAIKTPKDDIWLSTSSIGESSMFEYGTLENIEKSAIKKYLAYAERMRDEHLKIYEKIYEEAIRHLDQEEHEYEIYIANKHLKVEENAINQIYEKIQSFYSFLDS